MKYCIFVKARRKALYIIFKFYTSYKFNKIIKYREFMTHECNTTI